MYIFKQVSNKQHSCDSLLIHLVNSVNKLMTQHAVDIIKLEGKLQKLEENLYKEINQLKSWSQSKNHITITM